MWRDDLSVFDDVDERLFHHPTISAFTAQFPSIDLVDYPSATTPLYHLLLTPVALLTGDSLHALRLANLAISMACIWMVLRVLGRWGSARTAWPVALTMAASPYFVGPAARLSTDNLALLGIVATLAAIHPTAPPRPGLAGGWATVTILTRQIHAWLLPLLVRPLLKAGPHRAGWVGAIALPVVALGGFITAWGALTPPAFAKGHTAGINVDVLVFALSIMGVYACFFAPWLWVGLTTRSARRWAGATAAATLGLLVVHTMPWTDDPNRWGGAIWTASRHFPTLLDVPLPFWIGMPLGATALTAIAHHPDRQHGRFLVLAAGLWLAANLVSARAYQKYYDPFTLFLLAGAIQGIRVPRWAWVGPGILTAGLLLIDVVRFGG